MPTADRHDAGSFSWIELSTSNQDDAKRFYPALFGWTFRDSPMGPNAFYTMFEIDGRPVAAAYTICEDEVAMGVPPHWNLYIATANADTTAQLATTNGGRVLVAPLDVFTYGRMAVIQDPTGAVFCVWESKTHTGIGRKGEPNTFCWADLSTPDPAAAAKFYAAVFGYTYPPGKEGYLHIQNGDNMIGGIPPAAHRNPHVPPHWLAYFQVADCAAATAKAKELGAAIHMGPLAMENVGTLTVLGDPQGAVFALFQPARS
jgi:predicted enzyme related to lactoylglutathione lyase